jgi:hypothetical protein
MPYFRIPRISSNPEYEKLASLALKHQWVDADSGRWKEAVAQRVILFFEAKVAGIRTGMRVLSVLTQTIYTAGATNPPDWLKSTSRNMVKFIKYHHLIQSQMLIDVPQTTRPWQGDYTVDQNRMRLQQYIQQKESDTVVGVKSQSAGKQRNSCDLCFFTHVGKPCPLSTRLYPQLVCLVLDLAMQL